MRLIDADEAEKYLYQHLDDLHMIAAQNAIDEMPTIDVQPVKHGQWSECWRDQVRNVISVICSACGNASITWLPIVDLNLDDVPKEIYLQMPYCPKCGAKMNGA